MDNEDTILRCLESIKTQVEIVQIAHGPSKDKTRQIIDEFAAAHPQIRFRVIDVPRIEPYKYGFDQARNASVEGLENVVDWILWIDTDEYLSGDFTMFLRNSCIDAYVIPQHHFTVEPRGAPLQIDRPARLFRTGRGFLAKGHIHEHFELPAGGPGRVYELPRVDIGHTGYVDETVRQKRFHRNFEFLKWDNDEPEKRKLHPFLWFRDMIHWMRIYARDGHQEAALEVAKQAISFYNENWETMTTFGPGFQMSQQYLTEAYQALGKGVPMQITVQFDDRQAGISARFESYEQVERLFKFLVEPELKDRTDRYY
jgi:glycosyltransferase involved in cell wall biosynthesis